MYKVKQLNFSDNLPLFKARHLSHDFVALRNDNNTRDQECGVSAGKNLYPPLLIPRAGLVTHPSSPLHTYIHTYYLLGTTMCS